MGNTSERKAESNSNPCQAGVWFLIMGTLFCRIDKTPFVMNKKSKKSTPAKGKEHSKKFSANLQQRGPSKKIHSGTKQDDKNNAPNLIDQHILIDERNQPPINPNKVTRL